jgi:hypothetical protein
VKRVVVEGEEVTTVKEKSERKITKRNNRKKGCGRKLTNKQV